MTIFGDYHVHTPFCPHGTTDAFEEYINTALMQGLKAISFTEHAPLPDGFIDPTPNKDSGMNVADVSAYISTLKQLKTKYADKITINIGFEVDYIEGFEEATSDFLNQFGEEIDDAILSVHMLKSPQGAYYCLDFSSDQFSELIDVFGDIDTVYQTYYATLLKSIKADLGPYKPNRIGHITLIEKFKRVYPNFKQYTNELNTILDEIMKRNYHLDLNTAGLYKPDCQTIYPNPVVVKSAIKRGIPLIPGSDSHEASTLSRGFDQIAHYLSEN